MSAFKTLSTSDIAVTPFTVNKTFTLRGAELTGSSVGIDRYFGRFTTGSETTGVLTGSYTVYQKAVYDSIKQLYYSNYSSSRYNASGSYENYLASTLNWSIGDALDQPINTGIDRYFPFTNSYDSSVIGVMTIPNKMYGSYVVPSTFRIDYKVSVSGDLKSGSVEDDGQGNLIAHPQNEHVGNIIYEHGIATITNNIQVGAVTPAEYGTGKYGGIDIYGSSAGSGVLIIPTIISNNNITCSFQSAVTIYESQIKCTISPSEFTTTLNPTIFQGTGSVYSFVTGSYFAPYITTVGLYNDNQELLAVAKLAQPIQSSTTTDTTILVNIDR